jgi:hypothetical protein
VIKWGTASKVFAFDEPSIADLKRRRWIALDATNDAQINTEARAERLITAVVEDLSQPLATQTAVAPLIPFVELNDLYTFQADDRLEFADATRAVTVFEHYYGPDGSRTTMHVRGRPTGGVTRWERLREKLERETVETVEDEELTGDDLEFFYTTLDPSGGPGFSAAGTALASLGGFASITPVTSTIGGTFRDVDETERMSSVTLYRSFALINQSASATTLDFECPHGFIGAQETEGVHFRIALDPQGVYPAADLLSAISPDEETPPDTSPALVFVDPEAFDATDVLESATIPPGSGIIFHVEMAVSSAAQQVTSGSVVWQSSVPTSLVSA